MKRIVGFGQSQGLTIRLAYYPPYHSKYNPIERCWGVLENHWSGSLLDEIPTALRFARTMTWHGKHPLVQLIRKSYQKGVVLTTAEMKQLETQVHRLPGLEKWFVEIPTKSEPFLSVPLGTWDSYFSGFTLPINRRRSRSLKRESPRRNTL